MTKCEHRFLVDLFTTEIIALDLKHTKGSYAFGVWHAPYPVEKWFRNKMRSLSKENSTLCKMYNLYTWQHESYINLQNENAEAYNDLQDENAKLKKSLKFLKYWLKKKDKK